MVASSSLSCTLSCRGAVASQDQSYMAPCFHTGTQDQLLRLIGRMPPGGQHRVGVDDPKPTWWVLAASLQPFASSRQTLSDSAPRYPGDQRRACSLHSAVLSLPETGRL